ncbi:MAG TPA: hypothetical protein VMR45_01350 [Patescibacteria group bacterium]|jgi:hypothetical protein|nr:hypothetical protein [Patescibacteria group bacterium]
MNNQQKISPKVNVPVWMSGFYCIFTVSMVPWILHLLHTIPVMRMGIHWQIMWGVFDGSLLVLSLAASYFLIKKSAWASLPLMSLATLFVVDMWFDSMMSVTNVEKFAVLKITVAAEIPLTLLTAGSAIYLLHQLLTAKQQK